MNESIRLSPRVHFRGKKNANRYQTVAPTLHPGSKCLIPASVHVPTVRNVGPGSPVSRNLAPAISSRTPGGPAPPAEANHPPPPSPPGALGHHHGRQLPSSSAGRWVRPPARSFGAGRPGDAGSGGPAAAGVNRPVVMIRCCNSFQQFVG